MTDPDLVRKKLALIGTYLEQLRRLSRPQQLEHDLREQRFVEHTLQLAVQAMLDVASHIVSDERLGEPRSHRDLFHLLARHGWLAPEQGEELGRLAGFRNLLVHAYDAVDLEIVRDLLENRLGEFQDFVDAVSLRLG